MRWWWADQKSVLAQRESPTREDFYKTGWKRSEGLEHNIWQSKYKQHIKIKLKEIAKNAAFKQLMDKLDTHKKVKHIIYDEINMQPYLKSKAISTETAKILP